MYLRNNFKLNFTWLIGKQLNVLNINFSHPLLEVEIDKSLATREKNIKVGEIMS